MNNTFKLSDVHYLINNHAGVGNETWKRLAPFAILTPQIVRNATIGSRPCFGRQNIYTGSGKIKLIDADESFLEELRNNPSETRFDIHGVMLENGNEIHVALDNVTLQEVPTGSTSPTHPVRSTNTTYLWYVCKEKIV